MPAIPGSPFRQEASMLRDRVFIRPLFVLAWAALSVTAPAFAQIGKYVPVPAGSDADHALTEINATTDPTQKLALIDKFAATAQGDMAIVVDDTYVNYYLAAKN